MRLILLFLIILNISFASAIKSVEILKDTELITFDNVKSNQNFKRTKFPISKNNAKNDYWVKIKIDKTKLTEDKKYLLQLKPLLGINYFDIDETLKNSLFDKNTINLDINNLQDIYVKIYQVENFIYIAAEIHEQAKFIENFIFKNQLFGIAYGIVFASFLYYLAFFIYNRQKTFIYYSLTQLFMLGMIILAKENTSHTEDIFIFDIIFFGFLIFSNLFTKEFLNTKKHAPRLNAILTVIIFIYFIDFIVNISSYFPTSIFLIFYLITAVVIYNKTKYKPILFYITGWGIVIFSFILIDFQFYFIDLFKDFLNFEILIHVIAPLESLILAFALSYKIRLREEERIQSERLLIHQNKLAAMGEMISNIAHQWRQPLTHLSYIFMNINTAFKHQKLDIDYLNDKTKEATQQLEYMSHTIDDFRNFYSPQKERKSFAIKDEIQKSITIISATLQAQNISIEIKGENFFINGYNSEFSQVILNILTNAKDALVENEIQDPFIKLYLHDNTIKICDNALGILNERRNKIFEPYYTTKDKGTGVGLYMSKTIIENHFNGILTHQNIKDGSCFTIEL